MLRFRDLALGARFRFESESRFLSMKSGPWIKTGARRYVHAIDGMQCRVGSIGVAVVLDSPAKA
jgi:hypothetical protein